MKVLFIVNGYYPQPNAIGACVIRLQESLIRKGVHSDVITVTRGKGKIVSNEYGDIYSIEGEPVRNDTSFKGIIDRIKKTAPYFFTWPIMHPIQLAKTKRLIKKINEKNHYDAVIGVMLPIETVLAAVSFKNAIVYELDGLTCNPNYRRGIKKHLQHRVRYFENRIFSKAKLVLHLNCNKDWFSSKQYEKYFSKSMYTDLPNLIRFNNRTNNGFKYLGETHKIRMIYAGALVKDYRSPEYLLQLLKGVSSEIDLEAYFYTHGNCQQMIIQAEEETTGIIQLREQVPTEIMDSMLMEVDFLLSIGNSMKGNDRSLPSKTITYMASGKPIIHIAGNQNDSAITYLEHYELALILYPKDDFESNIRRLVDFLNTKRGLNVDFNETCKRFPQNKPEYTAEIIIDFCVGNHH